MGKRLMTLTVNGETVEVAVEPTSMLVDVLRDKLGLTGVKEGCGRGDCGACTVVLGGKAVPSCLVPAMKAIGKEVLTVEGLGQPGKLHPLQDAFLECGAVQCGFCTPGMLLSAKAFLDQNPSPTRQEARIAISGNLCRCTGYKKIVDAIILASERMRGEGGTSKK
ncbi:Nicotinate dehydrogenase small FeS subunit [subsurface metagenome]